MRKVKAFRDSSSWVVSPLEGAWMCEYECVCWCGLGFWGHSV